MIPLQWSSVPDDSQDQGYRSFDNADNAIPGIDSSALQVRAMHGTSPGDVDLVVAQADDSVVLHYDRPEDPFLFSYDASRGVVASTSHPQGHLMPRPSAPQLISGLGYQGTNWGSLDAFRQYFPNATLQNRGETGFGPLSAFTPDGTVAHNPYPWWTQSETSTSFSYCGQSFMLPYMTDSTIYHSPTPKHPIVAESGPTAASLANSTGLTSNTGMFNKDHLDIPSISGANPSPMVFTPFSQQTTSSESFVVEAVPPYGRSSSHDLNDATPNGSLDDVAVYAPQSGGTVRRRRGRNQVVVLKRRKYPGQAKYFCDDCASDNDFTTAGALNRHIKSKHNGVTYLCTFVGCERMYADETSLQRHRRQCDHA